MQKNSRINYVESRDIILQHSFQDVYSVVLVSNMIKHGKNLKKFPCNKTFKII